MLNVDFAVDGFRTRVVDIDKTRATYATIVANITVPTSPFWPGNYVVVGVPDDK